MTIDAMLLLKPRRAIAMCLRVRMRSLRNINALFCAVTQFCAVLSKRAVLSRAKRSTGLFYSPIFPSKATFSYHGGKFCMHTCMLVCIIDMHPKAFRTESEREQEVEGNSHCVCLAKLERIAAIVSV